MFIVSSSAIVLKARRGGMLRALKSIPLLSELGRPRGVGYYKHRTPTWFSRIMVKELVALAFVVLIGILIAAPQSAGQEDSKVKNEKTDSLPDGEGRRVMLQACVQCHDFKNIVAQRKTPEAWRRTVDEMAWRGAPLMPGEAEVLSRYLASSFGADKLLGASVKGDTPRTKFAQYLPEGKGRDLVVQSCVECHDLENVVSMRATGDEWRLTVKKMIRLGAEIDSSDTETIAAYLSSAFDKNRPIPDSLKKK